MRPLILTLPTLCLAGAAWMMSHAGLPQATEANVPVTQEIHSTRQEITRDSRKLDRLEGETHHVLPRGGFPD